MEDQNPFGVDNGSSDKAHDYRRQRRQPRKHEGDMKIELTKFDEKMQGVAFLDWLYTVERIF